MFEVALWPLPGDGSKQVSQDYGSWLASYYEPRTAPSSAINIIPKFILKVFMGTRPRNHEIVTVARREGAFSWRTALPETKRGGCWLTRVGVTRLLMIALNQKWNCISKRFDVRSSPVILQGNVCHGVTLYHPWQILSSQIHTRSKEASGPNNTRQRQGLCWHCFETG